MQGERQVVFVTGESGIGKTTLVDAFLAQLRERPDVRLTSGQCVEQYGPGEAYLPLLEATAQLCRGPGRERRIEALKRYAPSWLVQLPGLLDPEDCTLLQQHLQETSRERMLREMAEAAELFTLQRGLVVVLEDLHWSDVATLDWLTYMARRREPTKLMLLATYRSTEAAASNHPLRAVVQELTARNCCEEVRVTPFSEPAVSEYLACRLSPSIAASPLPGLIHQRTGGNPLFVVNLVDDLLQQGIVREEAGLWQVHGDQLRIATHVPDILRQVIARQLERLPVATQHLLEVASIIGVEFSAATVAAGLQTAVEEVDQQCEALARQGQFLQAHGSEEWPDHTLSERYSFQLALYQTVLAERMTDTQKVRIHRQVGERKAQAYGERATEIAAELAVHFEAGREYGKAVQYHRQAGEALASFVAPPETLRSLQAGRELSTVLHEDPRRPEQEEGLNPFSPASLQSATYSLSDAVFSPPSLSSTIPRPQSPTPNIFRLEGEYWTVSFAGATCRLKEARGLHYIAHLLQHPHQEVHVLTLIAVRADLSEEAVEVQLFQDPSLPFDRIEGCSDAGEILDPQARAAYKQRLHELQEELAEAGRCHDLGRSEQLAAEIDFLTHELSRAVGLGGRVRQMGAPAERARVSITRAIKLALRKIGKHHAPLCQHLATTLKTGVYCSYTPDVRMPSTWQM